MIDPALMLLLAGVVSVGLQAARSLLTGRSGVGSLVGGRLNLRIENGFLTDGERCYAAIVISDLRCVYDAREYLVAVLERLLVSDTVSGLVMGKASIDRGRLLSDIENRIMSLRVVLEREPGNKSVERRLKILERMHSEILSGRPLISPVLALVVREECGRVELTARRIADEIAKTGCKALTVSGERLLALLGLPLAGLKRYRLDLVAPTRLLLDTMTRYTGVTLTAKGVYIGRIHGDTPFTLPLWGEHGSLHHVVLGPTGRGKTTLVSVILARAHALGYAVYGVDPKGDMAEKLRGILDVKSISLREALHALLWLYGEGIVDKRLVARGLSDAGLEAIVEHVDEYLETCSFEFRDPITSRRAARLGLRGVNPCEKPGWIRRGVVYDVSGLPESLRTTAVITISYSALRLGGSLLVIDEAWRLGRMAAFHLIRLYKEARSRGLSIISATQDPMDLPDEIYNNSYGVIIFGSNDEKYVASVAKRFALGERETHILRVLGVGEALVRLQGAEPLVVEIDAAELLGGRV